MSSADWFLKTSTPPNNSGGTSEKLRKRPEFAEKVSRPLSSLRTCGRPRTTTPLPSMEKWSGSLPAAKRLIDTPGTRCNASVTERSGSAPMSSARDGIDEDVRVLLDFLRSLETAAQSRDDDFLEILGAFGGLVLVA